jgi:hypothetical protein
MHRFSSGRLASSRALLFTSGAARSYAQHRGGQGQANLERQVERDAPSSSSPAKRGWGASAKAVSTEVDPAKITKNAIWGLWNEGNLFSLTVHELGAFLKANAVDVDAAAKKSALVRQVEGLMATEQPPLTRATEDTVASINESLGQATFAAQGSDLYDEADVYGDWGAEAGFEDRKDLGFITVREQGLQDDQLDKVGLNVRAFQLLHSDVTSDVALSKFSAKKLPGCGHLKGLSLTPTAVDPVDSNKLRFRKAFQWSCTSLWNMNLDGEINIGAGKCLYWRSVAKHNRNMLPTWTCQDHLHTVHPYSWFAVAHESNISVMEKLAADMGMTQTMDAERSFKVSVKRVRDSLDIELNSQLQTTLVNKPWDRICVSHVLRKQMPDLRCLVRARRPIKKKVADTYYETSIVQLTTDSVRSVLSPELGDVVYTCERVIRKWAKKLECGVTLQLVETRRIPLIVTRQGEEGERIEYELIANVPQQMERVDLHALADELWEKGEEFAALLEEGLGELAAHTMPSSAAFDMAVK